MTTRQSRQAETHSEAMNDTYAELIAREAFNIFASEDMSNQPVVLIGLRKISTENTFHNVMYEQHNTNWIAFRNGESNDGNLYPMEEYQLKSPELQPEAIIILITGDPLTMSYARLAESMNRIQEMNKGIRTLVITEREPALILSGYSRDTIPCTILE